MKKIVKKVAPSSDQAAIVGDILTDLHDTNVRGTVRMSTAKPGWAVVRVSGADLPRALEVLS